MKTAPSESGGCHLLNLCFISFHFDLLVQSRAKSAEWIISVGVLDNIFFYMFCKIRVAPSISLKKCSQGKFVTRQIYAWKQIKDFGPLE